MAAYVDIEEREDTFDRGLWLEDVRGRVETLDCCLSLKSGVHEGSLGLNRLTWWE